MFFFFFSSRRRHTRYWRDWSSDVCSSDLEREMEGLRPDVAIVGANRHRRQIHDYTGRLMRALGRPALVLPTHHDTGPADPERTALAEEARTFAAEVRAASPGTRVVIPRWFEPIVVPARR